MWHLEVNRIVDPQQAGFRSHRSTDDNIAQLHEEVARSLANSRHTVGVFIDFENAYDMVWRTGLFLKLIDIGVTGRFLKYIINLFTNTSIKVKINNSLSDPVRMENGVIQGLVISPILSLVMINDLAYKNTNTKHFIFADDTAIIKSGKNLDFTIRSLQKDLDNIQDWCTAWGFEYQVPKLKLFDFKITPAPLRAN